MKDFELDKVIHQPIRTRIMAMLSNVKDCDYTTLKTTLKLSDGHMSTHMKELVENGYVISKKSFVDNKPRTTYHISKEGQRRFAEYLTNLKKLFNEK